MSNQDKVKEFHRLAKLTVNDEPTEFSETKQRCLVCRGRLVWKEVGGVHECEDCGEWHIVPPTQDSETYK